MDTFRGTHERYQNDAVYHSLVDWLAAFLNEGRLTHMDIRQALELAHELVERERLTRPQPGADHEPG